MAISGITPVELLSNVATDYLADSYLKEAPLLGLLSSNTVQQKQTAIEWGAKVGTATVGGRSILGNLSDDAQGANKGASLSIPDFYFKHQVTIGKQELIVAANTGKISDVRNPVRRTMTNALDEFNRKIQYALYNGNGTLDATNFGVIGLETITGSTPTAAATGSYAGISRATYPKWRSIFQAGTTPGTNENLTIDRVSDLLLARRKSGATYQQNNGTRLAFICNGDIERNVLRKLYGSAVDEQNYYEALSKDILPYVTYSISGIPVISDVDCPDNTTYAICLNEMAIYQFDQSDADTNNGKIQYVPLRYTDMTGNQPTDSPLIIRIADVTDEHPDKIVLELTTRFQLVVFDLNNGISKMDDINHKLP